MRHILIGLLFAASLAAQPRFPQHSTGWPGVPPLPVDSHPARLGATVAGRPLPLAAPGARHRPPVPIVGGPLAVSPGYWLPFSYSYAPQPAPVVVINTVTPPPAPPVVSVNADYKPETARPVMTEYFAESRPYEQSASEPGKLKVYLLALTDGSLRQALAFWREGPTLHFVLPDHKQSSVAFSSIDREASLRFNRERGLDLRLPE